ncbi:sodium- and chloride-dependent GABA transporter ine-like [Tubulanus polymorphus]|uniref:sodium- and chloride-dependent GABA transporter ine-like n=1 Tax=Tubulanus polymorphus TaxID=672921 RepID=UPI003DA66A76
MDLQVECTSCLNNDVDEVDTKSGLQEKSDYELMVLRENREQWGKKIEFLLACIGYAVGLGNIWRFPYLCYKSGGGAFLIPYFIMLFLCGIPLLYMELAVGQYTRRGPIGALTKLCPLFKGAGAATVVVSFLLCTYYNVIISWAFFYLFSSFRSVLPWATCNNEWNTDKCWANSQQNGHPISGNVTVSSSANTTFNMTYPIRPNGSVSPSEEFFNRRVLAVSEGLEFPGEIRWELLLLLILCWILVYFCLWKGVRSSGKVVYFTATFPYIVLIILLVRGVTLPGSLKGIMFFIKPKWELLLDAKVWVNAAAQNFNSIGIAFGSLIAMASYNKFNNNIFRDVMTVSLINSATSILAGFVIFSILGYIAENQGQEVVDVVAQGPGLVFVVYPEAFTTLPVSQLWATLFFIMLICLGIDSQFCMVEVICTTLQDQLGDKAKKYLKRKEIVVLIVCIIAFLLGLPNITNGGIYFFQLIDYFAAGISLMYLAFFEVVAITWVYGANKLARNVKEMTGREPQLFFKVCWYFFSPALILAIWIFGWVQYKMVTYGKGDWYTYPTWGEALGWMIAVCSIICIPAGAIHAFIQSSGKTLIKKLKNTVRPHLFGIEKNNVPNLQPNDRLEHVTVNGVDALKSNQLLLSSQNDDVTTKL